MVEGAPSRSTVIPGSQVTLTPARVTANTSTPVANSSGGFPDTSLGNSLTANKSGSNVGSKTIFKFDFPVFLNPGEYAFTLNSATSEYKLYAYELGALNIQERIEKLQNNHMLVNYLNHQMQKQELV